MKNTRFSAVYFPLKAGLTAALLSYSSAMALVYFAAQAAGADAGQIASWFVIAGAAMGLSSVALSLRYRMPLVTTWSVASAAVLASQTSASLPQVIGSLLVCGALICLCGITRNVDRLLHFIPMPLCAALLAGVLFRFAIASFSQLAQAPALLLPLIFAYLVFKRLAPRLYMLWLCLIGVFLAQWQGLIDWHLVSLSLHIPQWVEPEFSAPAILSLSLPMFILIMAAQNSAGLAQLRALQYSTPTAGLIGWTGFLQALLAPFGCFSLSIAAASASACQDPQIHADPAQRYKAGIAAGSIYLLLGLCGAALASILAILPTTLLAVLAGLALLSTLGNSLTLALRDEKWRESAFIAFAVTTSGCQFWQIDSAFWGLLAGLISALFFAKKRT